MKLFAFAVSLVAFLGLASCGTDYKEKHSELDKQEAQERIDDADSVKMDGDSVEIDD